MFQAVKSNLFSYADDYYLVFQGNSFKEIKNRLKEDFANLCDWLIHIAEDKTESILFVSKPKIKKVPNLIIKYKDIQIKQHSKVTYLGCILDEAISGLSMTYLISKINSRLKIVQRKTNF